MEIDFDRDYKDVQPVHIIEREVKRSLKTVIHIRDEGQKEENQLKAAKMILDRFLPRKIENTGTLDINTTITVVSSRQEGDNLERNTAKGHEEYERD